MYHQILFQVAVKEVLAQLHLHMEYKCVHKKFDTLLYNKNGDLLVSLSWALGRVSDLSEPTCDFTMGHSGGDNTKTKVLREAGEIVNDLIHEEINKSCSEYWQSNPNFFNILMK